MQHLHHFSTITVHSTHTVQTYSTHAASPSLQHDLCTQYTHPVQTYTCMDYLSVLTEVMVNVKMKHGVCGIKSTSISQVCGIMNDYQSECHHTTVIVETWSIRVRVIVWQWLYRLDGGVVERRVAAVISCSNICITVQQQLNHVSVIVQHGHVQSCLTSVLYVHLSTHITTPHIHSLVHSSIHPFHKLDTHADTSTPIHNNI